MFSRTVDWPLAPYAGGVNNNELALLMTPTALHLLDSLPRYTSSSDVVKVVSDLRNAGHSPELVATVLTQSKLRAKAQNKFGDFADRMLFTEAGLEQATRLRVAALHAGRFAAAGLRTVADLGCGIGADALALSALDLSVTAVEQDDVTAVIAAYNLAAFPNTDVVHGSAEDTDLSEIDGVYLDPARRTAGHSNTSRLTDPNDYSPSLDFAFELAERKPTGIKLGPGFDRNLIPADLEAQWVSVDGQVVENTLWSGPLAREGITRSALVLGKAGSHELRAQTDSEDVPVGELGEFLYEPDGAVIRARLIGELGRGLNATMVTEHIAYLSSAALVTSPFATAFRILDRLPADETKLKKELRARRIGTLEIKKRGVDVDPAMLRTRLSLKGPNSATLILTRTATARLALLAERL